MQSVVTMTTERFAAPRPHPSIIAAMNVFYEEDGAFKAGAVLADQQGAFQVESLSGKRSKIKRANVLIEFKEVAPATFLREAQLRSEEIDLDFLWECAPTEEFGFAELAEATVRREVGTMEPSLGLKTVTPVPGAGGGNGAEVSLQ